MAEECVTIFRTVTAGMAGLLHLVKGKGLEAVLTVEMCSISLPRYGWSNVHQGFETESDVLAWEDNGPVPHKRIAVVSNIRNASVPKGEHPLLSQNPPNGLAKDQRADLP